MHRAFRLHASTKPYRIKAAWATATGRREQTSCICAATGVPEIAITVVAHAPADVCS
jgi:hypothetical protein